jgi:hypothetical protein
MTVAPCVGVVRCGWRGEYRGPCGPAALRPCGPAARRTVRRPGPGLGGRPRSLLCSRPGRPATVVPSGGESGGPDCRGSATTRDQADDRQGDDDARPPGARPRQVPRGAVRAGLRGGDRVRPAGDRDAARRAARAVPAQRPQPAGPRRPGPALVRRSGHGARGPAARRPGRVVPQPLGALAAGGAGVGGAVGRRAGARRHGLRRQHPRHRPCRSHARHRRGRRAAVRAHRRARHRRSV